MRNQDQKNHIRRRLLEGRDGNGDNLGAVNEMPCVLTDHCKLGHNCFESIGHLLLFVHESLPFACSAGITGNSEIRLETQFSYIEAGADGKRRLDLTDTYKP